VNVWLDEAEIGIGDSLVKKISEGIEQVDYVAAVISNGSVKSEWVQKELSWAMTKEIEGQRVVVLPVVIERCELPGYLKDKLFADFTDPSNYDGAFFKFLEAVGIRKSPSKFTQPKRLQPTKDAVAIEDRILNFQEKIKRKDYIKAFEIYLNELGSSLYESGVHRISIETLNEFYVDGEYGLLFLEPSAQALVHSNLARSYKFAGKPRRALNLFERSLDLRNNSGGLNQSISVLRNLSRTALSLGDIALAENYVLEGIRIAEETGNKGKELGLHRQLGILYTYRGRFTDAINELSHLPKKFRSALHSDISPLSELCLNALLSGNTVKALHNARDMYRLAKKYDHKVDIVEASWLLGWAYLLSDDVRRVEHHLNEAFILCKETGFVEIEPDILITRSRYYSQTNKLDKASKDLSNALTISKWCGYILKEIDVYIIMSEIALKQGFKEDARKYALKAYNMFERVESDYRYKIAYDEVKKICSMLGVEYHD
jgi:tetratricopeptide (TPR) repeat protein